MIDFNECYIILHHKLEQSHTKYSFIIGNISIQYGKFREIYLILFTHSLNSLFNQSNLQIKTEVLIKYSTTETDITIYNVTMVVLNIHTSLQ